MLTPVPTARAASRQPILRAGCAKVRFRQGKRRTMTVRVSSPHDAMSEVEPIWFAIRSEAEAIVKSDPAVASFVYATVLNHSRLEDAVFHRIAARLDSEVVGAEVIRCAFREALAAHPELSGPIRCDIAAVYARAPATERRMEPL